MNRPLQPPFHSRAAARPASRGIAQRWLAALAALLLGACVSAGIRGHAPFAEINALRLVDQSLELDLGLRNPNTVPLLLDNIEFSIRLLDTSLAVYKAPSAASVLANGVENLRFQLSPSNDGLSLLHELESGERASLAYTLEGTIITEDGMRLDLDRKGHLYPVPGRPGQFR